MQSHAIFQDIIFVSAAQSIQSRRKKSAKIRLNVTVISVNCCDLSTEFKQKITMLACIHLGSDFPVNTFTIILSISKLISNLTSILMSKNVTQQNIH